MADNYLKPFKYSGSKTKLLKLFNKPPNYSRIVEPYGGGASYSINDQKPAIVYDINRNIIDLFKWLKVVDIERLYELENMRKEAVDNHPKNKPDVRTLNVSEAEQTYIRLNACSVYVGQLSSWTIYPQWKLPIEKTIECLQRIRQIDFIHGNVHNIYENIPNDLVFIDPPYVGTHGNYREDGKSGIEESYSPKHTINLINKIKSPIIFTYGDNARETFPNYNWQILLKKRVPNMRKGGTTERTEHVCYINF